jgi:hypothetical protein
MVNEIMTYALFIRDKNIVKKEKKFSFYFLALKSMKTAIAPIIPPKTSST